MSIERWLIVGGYDGARHANFVRSGPQLTPNGEPVEVIRHSDHMARIAEKDRELKKAKAFGEEQANNCRELLRQRQEALGEVEVAADERDAAEGCVTELEARIEAKDRKIAELEDGFRREEKRTLEAEDRMDAAEARFTALLDAMTGDAAVEAARRWSARGYPSKNWFRATLQAARTAALEAVEEK